MGKINLLIANANDNLSGKLDLIKKAIKTAEDYTFGRLDINWDIDVLVTTRIYDIIIPEDGRSLTPAPRTFLHHSAW